MLKLWHCTYLMLPHTGRMLKLSAQSFCFLPHCPLGLGGAGKGVFVLWSTSNSVYEQALVVGTVLKESSLWVFLRSYWRQTWQTQHIRAFWCHCSVVCGHMSRREKHWHHFLHFSISLPHLTALGQMQWAFCPCCGYCKQAFSLCC